MPSLAKVADPEGEIFDDLDDDESIGARVASREKTDQVRKSQIMDLNKQNQWKKFNKNHYLCQACKFSAVNISKLRKSVQYYLMQCLNKLISELDSTD